MLRFAISDLRFEITECGLARVFAICFIKYE